MDEQPKRYPHLPPEEEARLPGVPVNIIKIERDVNARLNQPEVVKVLNDWLGCGKAEPDALDDGSDSPPRPD